MGAADIARPSLADARIDHVAVGAYRIPTDAPESDGTLEWNATTLVVKDRTGTHRLVVLGSTASAAPHATTQPSPPPAG